jgi:hypothetical protein
LDSPAPPPPIPATDPRLDAQSTQASADEIKALQIQSEGDTASLMARYGTRLALAGVAGTSPLLMGQASTQMQRA